MRLEKSAIASLVLTVLAASVGVAQDPGWPRKLTNKGATLLVYQPQVDDWPNFTQIDFRAAISLTPAGGKPVIGAFTAHGTTEVVQERDLVLITGTKITNTYFPSLEQAQATKMDQLLRTFLKPEVAISLHRVIASTPKKETLPTVQLNNDPPQIYVAYSPSILLFVDGPPALRPVPNTSLQFVLNTTWPLFFDKAASSYYLLAGQVWLTSNSLEVPWAPATTLPAEMSKVPADPQWASLKSMIPPPRVAGAVVPSVFYADKPAEVILFDGEPAYSPVPGTQLTYATNTVDNVFVYTPTQQYYFLAAGRWFKASSLQGPWSYATPDLPPDFARIPPESPAGRVLSSVPGTDEAKDSVLMAQIPTTITVNPAEAAAKAKVTYDGAPQFAPITGTSLSYATNTPNKVIQVGDVYYLCLSGLWFMSATPQGPWTTATSVPSQIYTIPPSSPIYNVTYVTQTVVPSGYVQSSYTAGYLGAIAIGATVGAVVACGTGYYYPPYMGGAYWGYHPYPMPYGSAAYYHPATGAYSVSQTAYGAYGSVSRGASYNPYTGTYGRGASEQTAYSGHSVGQAYNPYTGNYAATSQGHNANAQWGSTYRTNGSESAYTQHYSNAWGTAASGSTSSGGKAYASSGALGNSYAAKSSNGDMYAGHDGNVYQNTGSGWQKYDNGSWNNVNTQQAQQEAQQRQQSYQQQHPQGASSSDAQQRAQSYDGSRSSGSGFNSSEMSQEAQDRSRGTSQSDRFSGFQRSGGWGGGGGRSWGGGGRSFGGGGRRW